MGENPNVPNATGDTDLFPESMFGYLKPDLRAKLKSFLLDENLEEQIVDLGDEEETLSEPS
jgi:hypothetical protein